ncbi:MAG: type III-B CRISPR module-associated protein Cmr5 [Gammaproteobacteria bacterium]|nr:MAG: type III-B CRISPR module-associated protein Cmr5 [Gammaproteobacteria bacterium]
MKTLEQQYAAAVYQKIQSCTEWGDKEKKRYGVMAQKLPVLIRSAGLAQALAFVDAKASGSNEKPYHQLLDDLASVLGFDARKDLLNRSREAHLSDYAHLSRRAILALTWFKRFSQSILKVDLTDSED